MYLEGVLIEARDLVNGVSIVQAESVEKVEYFHIELDSHDVIIAEGALSETFVDDDSRGMFHNAREYGALYPDAARVAARYCAKRCADGYEVEAARRHINARAGLLPEVSEALGTLRGYVDRVNADRIEGWAQNPQHPEAPICLDIFAGGELIGRTLANRPREDLRKAGLGSGRHSFVFVPETVRWIGSAIIEVRRSSDGKILASSDACKKSSMRKANTLNRSAVMKRAWAVFRADNAHISRTVPRPSFAECLRKAWAEDKRSAQTLADTSRVRLSA
jgi:O-antigen biosynthesis protein